MTTYTTEATRDAYNNLELVTKISMGPAARPMSKPPEMGERRFEITTTKSGREIKTSATVFWCGGGSKMHVFGLGGPGDFRETIARVPCSRATQAALEKAHAAAMPQFAAALERATAHYAAAKHLEEA